MSTSLSTIKIVPRLTRGSEAALPSEFGDFRVISYWDKENQTEHLALVKGDLLNNEPALVRVHSECLTGEVFGSLRCDCGWQLSNSLEMIEKNGAGIFVYVKQEGRGIGLHNKIQAYALQDKGFDTVEANHHLGFSADSRDYSIAALILVDLGVKKIRLLTNNPQKILGLEGSGIEIVERISIEMNPGAHNEMYLRTKKDKLGHLLKKV